MNENQAVEIQRMPRKNVWLLLFLGIAGAYLFHGVVFYGHPLGINVLIAVLCCYGVILGSQKGNLNLRRQQNWLLLPFIAALCATFFLYNNLLLLILNGIAVALLIPLQISLMTDTASYPAYTFGSFCDVFFCLFVRPFHRIGQSFPALFRGFSGKEVSGKNTKYIWIGILIALPVVAALTALLSSADMVFSDMLSRLSTKTILDGLGYLVLAAAVCTLSASFIYSLAAKKRAVVPPAQGNRPEFSLISVYIVLISVSLLLFIFGVIQCLFLFGGAALPEGVSYSTYARTGFFQLCAASVLVFCLTAVCMAFTKQAQAKQARFLRILYTWLNASNILLLVSSFCRMVLYEQAYQYTQLRLYVQFFILLLGAILVLTILKIWRQKFPLAKCVCFAILISLSALSYFNVDGFIARENSRNMPAALKEDSDGMPEDPMGYLYSLSADALPGYAHLLLDEDFLDDTAFRQYQKYANFADFHKNDFPDGLFPNELAKDENEFYATLARYQNTARYYQWRARNIFSLYKECKNNSGDLRSYNTGRAAALEFFTSHPEFLEKLQSFQAQDIDG